MFNVVCITITINNYFKLRLSAHARNAFNFIKRATGVWLTKQFIP